MNPNALDQAKGFIKSAELKYEIEKFGEILRIKSEVKEEFKSQTDEIKNLLERIKSLPETNESYSKEIKDLKNELTNIKSDLKKNMEIAAAINKHKLTFDEKKALAGRVISELTGRKL
jgi:uncharacterized coiled-coil DUF342 family protein